MHWTNLMGRYYSKLDVATQEQKIKIEEYKIDYKLDLHSVSIPQAISEYAKLTKEVLIPNHLKTGFVVGFKNTYYYILVAIVDDDARVIYYIKKFDFYHEFDSKVKKTITSHTSTYKQVASIRPRIDYTADGIKKCGLDIGDEFEVLLKESRGNHPGYMVMWKKPKELK